MKILDTIAAVSTPYGKGGVALIRISGADAFCLADKVFYPVCKRQMSEIDVGKMVYGSIFEATADGESIHIDDGMAVRFASPHSFTGEDTVEISCHGGILVTKRVLGAVLAAGARQADAGEFTRRAFINGKITLTEAEAIGNLLEAESLEQIKMASKKSRSHLSGKIEQIRSSITAVLSSIYARIDYPDEDLGDFSDSETLQRLTELKDDISALSDTYRTGKAISEGIKTVICGKPNVGKSSLYNILLERDAAIVTDIEGTTRDVLSEKIQLGKVMLRLSDTAGIRSRNADRIEKIGIERSYRAIDEAELILAVFDSSRKKDAEDDAIIERIREVTVPKIAILNKCDMSPAFDRDEIYKVFDLVLEASMKNGEKDVRESLITTIDKLFIDEKISVGNDAIISSARQSAAIKRSLAFIDTAIEAYSLGISTDAASSDIELALGAIAELDGKAISDEVVKDIFSKFCVGK